MKSGKAEDYSFLTFLLPLGLEYRKQASWKYASSLKWFVSKYSDVQTTDHGSPAICSRRDSILKTKKALHPPIPPPFLIPK